MKSEQCPYLVIKDNPVVEGNRVRLDTTCRIDCPLNGATFLSTKGHSSSRLRVINEVNQARREYCKETGLGKALAALKSFSSSKNRPTSS